MRTVVAVLRGGPSSEYEVSLQSGASVLASLDAERYEPRDIFISKSGEWHRHGIPMSPHQALRGVDAVFNALHGHFGEDGKVQQLLDSYHIPYTGSRSFPSSLAFNKHRTKEAVVALGIKVPQGALVSASDGNIDALALSLFRSFPMPVVIKPVIGGSSVGTTVAKDFFMLTEGLRQALEHAPKALVEEYIRGREATVGVIDRFRGEDAYALFPVEIIPPQNAGFFNYSAKYGGASVENCPGNFSEVEKRELMRAAQLVHRGLDLSHYSRSDFIVSRRGIYFLEVNTLPGLTKESLLPKAVRAVGSSLPKFIEHVIDLARGV